MVYTLLTYTLYTADLYTTDPHATDLYTTDPYTIDLYTIDLYTTNGGDDGGCREMELGNANLGDEGDEGKGPSPLGARMWERRWVSRDATWESKSWRRG